MRFHNLGTIGRMGALLAALTLSSTGCFGQKSPLIVQVTQLAPYQHAAKPPDCSMPVLSTLPLTNYDQVAIVEAWADLKDTSDDVVPALQRKACETGADALVIVNSSHQDIKNLLYQASPNESQSDVDAKGGGAGAYIRETEHTRLIGEAGHNGFYVDAVAINYRQAPDKSGASGNPPESPPPNG
ncbi:MAG: hypothetical protein ABSG46_07780 [Candidatus Binataceae bacterium]|jgi:hypothetical protein